jgi:uncharacterized protein YggT (Ycf19 family)
MTVLRYAVFALVSLAVLVAVLSWLVRERHVSPFGPLGRLCRAVSDPFLKPIERRLVRGGGNPVQAGWWLVLGTAVLGLVVIFLAKWLVGVGLDVSAAARGGRGAVFRLAVNWAYLLLVGALIVRVVASWFGMFRYNKWIRPAYVLTDWIVRPLGRVLPQFSGWDWSPLVAWLLLLAARNILLAVA